MDASVDLEVKPYEENHLALLGNVLHEYKSVLKLSY